MAGVTDRILRLLCRQQGAGLAIAEMSHSHPNLRTHKKSRTRGVDLQEPSPRIVQLLGYDASMLADAARYHAYQGADIIDLNHLGCPAKKVCQVAAGSALMGQPEKRWPKFSLPCAKLLTFP